MIFEPKNETSKNHEKVRLLCPKVSKIAPKWTKIGAWKHTFPELVKPWFWETLQWFCMVFAPPGVQESTETRKEIAPGKHMPKKYENLGAESKKTWKCKEEIGMSSPRKFTFFWPGCFLAPFWSQGRFETSFGPQNDEKMDPQGPQGPQNQERMLRNGMEF